MKFNTERIVEILAELEQLIEEVQTETHLKKDIWKGVSPTYTKSARNLIQYQKLRSFDTRPLQKKLEKLGMSRLAKAESHVMASLGLSRFVLSRLIGKDCSNNPKLSIKKGQKLLDNHTCKLLGYRSRGRRVRIMVTLSSEVAANEKAVMDMIRSGMNCARINCAHDGPEEWEKMILSVRRAAGKLNRTVKICMDLAGPKIRTGPIAPGPKVRKFAPVRNDLGQVVHPACIRLVDQVKGDEPNCLAVPGSWREKLAEGDRICLTDTRNKKRVLKVGGVNAGKVFLNAYDTVYIAPGTLLTPERGDPAPVLAGEMPSVEPFILLTTGDRLIIHRQPVLGKPSTFDLQGNQLHEAFISCTLPEVFQHVKKGTVVYFDEGKIKSVVEEIHDDSFTVRITRAKESGTKLRADKGINFPGTDLGLKGLTTKDKKDLAFIAEHADIVNFSFISDEDDVEELILELNRLNALNKLHVIFKIETQKAYNNLIRIILAGMSLDCIGVMIARGDLAIETGWKNMGRIQREILMICSAGHIPVVWATQVLENLSRKGLPSRAELTDVASSLLAECVLLNKGPYVNKTIKMLDEILREMEDFQEKRAEMLPRLEKMPMED